MDVQPVGGHGCVRSNLGLSGRAHRENGMVEWAKASRQAKSARRSSIR